MKILVCVKNVPDPESMVFRNLPSITGENWSGADMGGRMNRYDEYALELALRLSETGNVTRIDAVTVGPEGAAAVLRRAIGMGADHGTHILQGQQPFASPFAIGGLIAGYAREIAYDLILCGAMSEDLMQGLVGPVIAGLLDWPCLTSVHALACQPGARVLRCEREVEGGRQQLLELDLPAVVSIQSGIHPPRYPALSKLLRANRYPLEMVPAQAQAEAAARQRVGDIRGPETSGRGIILNGTAEQKAQALARMLRDRGLC
jgi:electron transfer flavoprotein beta subunit